MNQHSRKGSDGKRADNVTRILPQESFDSLSAPKVDSLSSNKVNTDINPYAPPATPVVPLTDGFGRVLEDFSDLSESELLVRKKEAYKSLVCSASVMTACNIGLLKLASLFMENLSQTVFVVSLPYIYLTLALVVGSAMTLRFSWDISVDIGRLGKRLREINSLKSKEEIV